MLTLDSYVYSSIGNIVDMIKSVIRFDKEFVYEYDDTELLRMFAENNCNIETIEILIDRGILYGIDGYGRTKIRIGDLFEWVTVASVICVTANIVQNVLYHSEYLPYNQYAEPLYNYLDTINYGKDDNNG